MQPKVNHRPFHIRLLNRSDGLLKRLGGLPPLDRDLLLQRAQQQTGLDDFGDDDFLEGLDRLLESLHKDAFLNTVGNLSTRTYLLQLLTNRLRLEVDRKRLPSIGQQTIERPVFIVGLPRTGSTFLFELMCQDTNLRPPWSWEVMYPSPPPGTSRPADTVRRLRAGLSLSLVDVISPQFRKIHPVGAKLPQECIAIQTHAFRSIQFHTTNRVDRYQTWLEREADWRPAYTLHKRFLQHCQAGGAAGRWLLKAPGHLYSMDALLDVYPDACFIQTHRDPLAIIPSITSHCVALRQAFSDFVDVAEIGEFWAGSWQRALTKAMAWRDKNDHDQRFLDIHYADLTTDPLDTVRRIYEFLDMELTTGAARAMAQYIRKHPQNRHGRHRYTLSAFGLSAAREQQRFGDYIDRFDIPVGRDIGGSNR